MRGLPVYEAKIDMNDDSVGMFVISLVDAPAVEYDFLAFDKDKKTMTYKITNTEEQKVFGVVMAVDKPIYRNDNGYEYYITYSKETVALMAEKYFKNGLQNNVDTNHNFELEDGITLTQMFIKNTEKGVNPNEFDDVNDGSLFAEFHIENTEVWEAIKKGEYKGFSLAGTFIIEEVETEEDKEYNEIMSLLDKLNKIKNKK